MVHSEVYMNKYVVSIAPFSPLHPIQKTALFCMFSLFNLSSIFQGRRSADPICPDVRTPMMMICLTEVVRFQVIFVTVVTE